MRLTERDYEAAAAELGCSVAAIKAVSTIEAPKGAFLPDGRPPILFEAHHFSRLTHRRFDHSHPRISSPKWNRKLYRNAYGEHERLAEAAALDRNAALQSASWGAYQIMGFNYRDCGFPSVQAFVNAMYRSEAAQLRAFVKLIKAWGLADELQRLDFEAFAYRYNGPRHAENRYAPRMLAAYRDHNEGAVA